MRPVPDGDLPPWPTPPLAHVADAAELDVLCRRLAGLPAIGIALEVTGESGRDVDPDQGDRRRGTITRVVLATRDAREGPRAFAVELGAIGVAPLWRLLGDPDGPYLVFPDAHAACHRLARRAAAEGIADWTPGRVGCIRTAATLLAEGRRRGRELPGLDDALGRVLHHRLESGLFATGVDAAAATRADAALAVMEGLTPMLRRRDLIRAYQLECRLVPAVVAMELAGIGVDAAAFQRIADGWSTERATATEPDRIARLDKLLSTYAYWPREFIRDDRIHPLLHPLAADSGRFACTDPNLQQVPSEHVAPGLRSCFRARTGHKLVIADYAQIELRVAAHLAPCDALRRVFREGRDPHRATAATLTGKPEAAVTERERKLAKAVNFGFLFGMGPDRFRSYAHDSYGLELDDQEAKRAKEAFLETYPGIAAWHRKVAQLGRPRRPITVRTALGRRKRFEAGAFSFSAALNVPVQGTAADGFKLAMVELRPRLSALGGQGVLCVHDEYIAEVPEARAEAARAIVVQTMERCMSSVIPSVPVVVEAEIADTWS